MAPGETTAGSPRMLARWSRMLLKFVRRREWRYRGLLLWLVARPSLRFLPFPWPSCHTVQQYAEQPRRRGAPQAAHREISAAELKDLIFLHQKVGNDDAFPGNQQGEQALSIVTSPRRAMQRVKWLAAQERVRDVSDLEVINPVIGPKGGVPKKPN